MQDPSRDWTTMGILRAAFGDLRLHPVGLFLLIGVLPRLWEWSSERLFPHLRGDHLPHDVPELALAIAGVAWDAVLVGGSLLVALQVARGGAPRLSEFVRGLRFAVRVVILSLFTHFLQLLHPLVQSAPVTGVESQILALVAALAAFTLMVRFSFATLLVVDAGSGVWGALTGSWAATRGHFWRVARVYLLSGLLYYPAKEIHVPLVGRLVWAFVATVMAVLLTHVYLVVIPSPRLPGHLAGNSPLAHPEDELPIRGTGWAQDVPRKPGES